MTKSCCCPINCYEPLTNIAESTWKSVKEGCITLKDGIKKIVRKFFETAKQATGSFEGWKKLAGVISPVAALALRTECKEIIKPLEVLAAQFETFKLLQGGMAWVGIGDDLFKKVWIENPKSKNQHGENYIGTLKRILLIGVNSLKLVSYGTKIGLLAEVALSIGSVPVISCLLTAVTSLSLIGNGLTFWTIANDKYDVNKKMNRMRDNNLVTPKKRLKLEARLKELIHSRGKVPIDGTISGFSYTELKRDIGLQKAEIQVTDAKNALNNKSHEMNEIEIDLEIANSNIDKKDSEIKLLEKKRSALRSEYTKLTEEFAVCSNILDAYILVATSNFEQYKVVKYQARLADLDKQSTKNWIDVTCNVISLVGLSLGLGKAYFGMEAMMSFFHVEKEDVMKDILSTISLVTGTCELFKFFYEENHKEEPKKVSIIGFAPCTFDEDEPDIDGDQLNIDGDQLNIDGDKSNSKSSEESLSEII